MNDYLFDEFEELSAAAWKQKIQVDLKGLDYNETLLWKTNQGVSIKPFYTSEDRTHQKITTPKKGFIVCQTIFVDTIKIANTLAKDALQRGATAIQFIITKPFIPSKLLKGIDLESTTLYFKCNFLSSNFLIELSKFTKPKNTYFQIDIIGKLAETGNWYLNSKEDFKSLHNIIKPIKNCISIDGDLYQNAGANHIQQLAYTLAHANEYLNYFGEKAAHKIHFIFSVGSNYFFEIAKLRAFRLLWSSLLATYNYENQDREVHIFVQPSTRNKTLYDYNVNMLRTTSECMSAILGGANTISNISYDTFFRKSNEFGERIARNQLLILQEESGLKEAQGFVEGTYYIESLTHQLAEKSLVVFKQIEKAGGFLKQLKDGQIQKKINESAQKEDTNFITKEIKLLGTNIHPNKNDTIKESLDLYPFVKRKNNKTLISPIIKKRLSEPLEKQRLKLE